jgi:alpha-mannosidase
MTTPTDRSPMMAVPAWLILGAFPTEERRHSGWLFDGPPGEPDFRPEAGDKLGGRRWTRHAPSAPFIDFLRAPLSFPQQTWCYAYALTYVYSPRRQNVRWLAGSDDGLAVWLDGELIHTYDAGRGLTLDQDEIRATLEAGWHTVLCKVTQHELNWGLSLRINTSQPDAAQGLVYSTKRPPLRHLAVYRRASGTFRFHGAPRVQAGYDGDWFCSLRLRLFNDSREPARAGQIDLLDADGHSHASASFAVWPPFGGDEISLQPHGTAFLTALADERAAWRLNVRSSLGSHDLPFDARVLARATSRALLGFSAPALPNAVLRVPDVFRGAAAEVRLLPLSASALAREIPWPDLPSRAVSPKETATGRIVVGLTPPRGMPKLIARIVFGNPAQRQVLSQVEALLQAVSAEPPKTRAALCAALRGVAANRPAEFFRALQKAIENFAASEPAGRRGRVTLVGHAHIDMNWLWTTPETIKCCHDTFRQVLTFMDEFPTFHFSQSQSAVYRYIEEYDPVMFQRIRKRVAAGRWELLGGMVAEGDTNLVSGEGLARSLLLGQRYFRSRFHRLARVGWLPDNFGHAAQLPQVLQLAGIRYFYGHRCQPGLGPYQWVAPDGSCVLVFATETYNVEVTPELRKAPARFNPVNGRVLCVYGVGDHGGGPTRRDIRNALEYAALPAFPQIELGTAERLFASLEADRGRYPVHRGERQYVFEGCYSAVARIKAMNRRCENALYAAEMLAALAEERTNAYPAQRLAEAWETVAFNQFHDILCGSAVHESNHEALARYGVALETAEKTTFGALRQLAAGVRTRANRGQPLVVFNPLPKRRTDVAEVELFTHLPPAGARLRSWGSFLFQPVVPEDAGQGPFATLKLVDEQNRPVNAQIVDGKLFPNGYRLKARFVAKDVPACGWRTFYARPEEVGSIQGPAIRIRKNRIETPLLIVGWDPVTGHLTRLFDKVRGKECLLPKRPANVLRVDQEAPHGMSAWELGTIKQASTLDKADCIRVIETGPVRAVLEIVRTWDRSTFTQRVIVYRDLPRVDFELDAVWYQLGNPVSGMPSLRVSFPVNVQRGRFFCDTPFAAVERPATGREVPAQKWTDLAGRSGGVALLNDGQYGHRCAGDTLEMTLLRSSYEPDLYPDQGVHHMRYSLVPHAGNYRAGGVPEAGLEFNLPLLALETPPNGSGERRDGAGLLAVTPAGVYLSAVKKAEDGPGLVVRFFEDHGRSVDAQLVFARPVRRTWRVNLLEDKDRSGARPRAAGRTVRVKIRPHEIASLYVELK